MLPNLRSRPFQPGIEPVWHNEPELKTCSIDKQLDRRYAGGTQMTPYNQDLQEFVETLETNALKILSSRLAVTTIASMGTYNARQRKENATLTINGKPSYPIGDKAHARKALQLLNTHKPPLTGSQKSKVRAKAAKFGVVGNKKVQ